MAENDDWLMLGYVAGAHGIRGEVKLKLLTDDLQSWLAKDCFWLKSEQDQIIERKVCKSRIHKDQLLVLFEGFSDRNTAEKLRSQQVLIKESELPVIEDDDVWYYYQLLGMIAVNSATSERIGQVTNVFSAGANDVLEITQGDNKRINIPFINDAVEINDSIITIKPAFLE